MLGFRTRLVLAFTILASGFTTAAVVYFYQVAKEQVYEQMALRLKDLGRLGQYQLSAADRRTILELNQVCVQLQRDLGNGALSAIGDGDVRQPLSEEQVTELQRRPDFQRLVQVMRGIKRSTRISVTVPQNLPQSVLDPADRPQIRFVYLLTMIPESPDRKYLRFIVDGDYEALDTNGNGQMEEDEEPTEIGMIYNVEGQPELREAFDGKVLTNHTFVRDAWGLWFSSYTPIIDPETNQVIAVMGIDLDVEGPANALNRTFYIAAAICVASLVLSVGVAFIAAAYFGRPIRALTEAADRVRNRDFQVRAPVFSRDELGRLTETFNTMVADIGAYSNHMEEMVARRTQELQEALNQVQALKLKQDADYFLTTLLTNPLLKNNNSSPAVQTAFLIEQKKRFRYKASEAHLGGDVCITGNLRLQGQNWTLFLNGDAMGKSMQGAGGALVLGTIVNSMLRRSEDGETSRLIGPEEWLRDACNELQKVFVTFDGSMLISCIMGLLNESDGRLIYFNAEHPALTLYRKGQASFLDEAAPMRKIGFPFISGFSVVRAQLEAGDVLFAGSDGKDDLRMGGDEGVNIMNEDEQLFLRIVEQSHGDLDQIRQALARTGEIIDDLSIVRVEYLGPKAGSGGANGEDSSAESANQSLRQATHLIRERKYSVALQLLEQHSSMEQGFLPLYYRGYCLSRLGRSREALPLLEQAYQQDRLQTAVLRLLGKLYLSMGDARAATRFLSEAVKLEPEHENSARLLRKLQQVDEA